MGKTKDSNVDCRVCGMHLSSTLARNLHEWNIHARRDGSLDMQIWYQDRRKKGLVCRYCDLSFISHNARKAHEQKCDGILKPLPAQGTVKIQV